MRIRCRPEFAHIFSHGEKIWGRIFVCHALVNDADVSRLGLVVSRKVGGAVVRNRVKRCIREFFRLNQHRLTPGLQLVVVARRPSAQLNGSACVCELASMLGRFLHDA